MGQGDGKITVSIFASSGRRETFAWLTKLAIPSWRAHRISSLYSLVLAIQDLESLLVLDNAPLDYPTPNPSVGSKGAGKIKEKEKEPYNRDQYWSCVADKKAAFLKLYWFCFALAKPPYASL